MSGSARSAEDRKAKDSRGRRTGAQECRFLGEAVRRGLTSSRMRPVPRALQLDGADGRGCGKLTSASARRRGCGRCCGRERALQLVGADVVGVADVNARFSWSARMWPVVAGSTGVPLRGRRPRTPLSQNSGARPVLEGPSFLKLGVLPYFLEVGSRNRFRRPYFSKVGALRGA